MARWTHPAVSDVDEFLGKILAAHDFRAKGAILTVLA